ncbi:MAG: energy transducer TonB [Gammaproteobacteria bacterium]
MLTAGSSSNDSTTNNNRFIENNNSAQIVAVTLLSVLLHSGIIFWFASQSVEFPTVEFSEFKVGLVSSEGLGETLQANLPDIVAVSEVVTEESGIVALQDKSASDVIQEQVIVEEIEQALTPVQSALTENIEVATVISSEAASVADVSLPEIKNVELALTNEIEESRPIEVVETIVPSASSNEEVIETAGISAEVENVDPVNDFFKPAEILSEGDPIASLPIEYVVTLPAPTAIQPDNNPVLVSNDVEILEIKARDVITVKPKPTTTPKKVAILTRGDESSRPRQSLAVNVDSNDADQKPLVKKAEPPKPVVIPKTYVLELKNWLSQYKKYPANAYRLKQEGVAIVGIVINRSGEIISYDIRRSSGHKELDLEVENMIKRAAKMPALPADFPRDQLELLIPIRFKVKG